MLRWIAQHLDNKYLHSIDKTIIESIIGAPLKEGVRKTRMNHVTCDQYHSELSCEGMAMTGNQTTY